MSVNKYKLSPNTHPHLLSKKKKRQGCWMLQPQQVLQGRYQLEQKLGSNPGRETWLAKDLSAQEKVAVKLLTFCDQVQWERLRLFEREAQVMKQLNHPRIPKYRDYFCLDEQMLWFGLVQSYIPGKSLQELLNEGRVFTEAEARRIAVDILNILVYLHSLSPPVLHRDIKPSNLLISKDSQIYLVDFGAVQDRAAKEGATFTVVGTYGYAPLEQFGGRATPASDIYASGATLIHLLAAIPPADLPQRDSRLQFSHLLELNPGFVRILEKMTHPNLETRFHSAKEVLASLQENATAIANIVSPQPDNSYIQLKKSPNRLQIEIPPSWLGAQSFPKIKTILLAIAYCTCMCAFTIGASDWQILIIFILGLGLLGLIVIPRCLSTNIGFDHEKFEIKVKLFWLCLLDLRGKVSEIDKIFVSNTGGFGDRKAPEVQIAVGVSEYSLGRVTPPLSKDECRWLAFEIRQWLGL